MLSLVAESVGVRRGATLSHLPLEILDDIALYLSKRDLHTLLFVSRSAYRVFVPALYRDMDITFSGSSKEIDTALALVDTLTRTQRLVLLIKHLRMHLFLNAEGTTAQLLLALSDFFASIPPHRSPLRTLRFTAWLEDWEERGEQTLISDMSAIAPIILESFNKLRLPCLHTLILDGALPGLEWAFDARPFLGAHPGLKTLDVSSQFLVPEQGTIPLLEEYTGRPTDVINVCHSRPIRGLRLYLPSAGTCLVEDSDGTGEIEELILNALGEAKELRRLEMVPSWPEGTCIEVRGHGQGIMPPQLVKEVVRAALRLDKLEVYVGDTLMETLAVISQLKGLQELVLHCQRDVWEPSASPPTSDEEDCPPTPAFDDLTEDDVFPLSHTHTALTDFLLPACPELRKVVVEWRGWRRYWGEEIEEGEFADWEQKWVFAVREEEERRLEVVR